MDSTVVVSGRVSEGSISLFGEEGEQAYKKIPAEIIENNILHISIKFIIKTFGEAKKLLRMRYFLTGIVC
jgi:hypothetical protein